VPGSGHPGGASAAVTPSRIAMEASPPRSRRFPWVLPGAGLVAPGQSFKPRGLPSPRRTDRIEQPKNHRFHVRRSLEVSGLRRT